MPGDKIVKVDDQDVTTISDQDFIVSIIKGEENKITVFRPSEGTYVDFDIKIENITSELIDKDIGKIFWRPP